ncbi:MAG: PKD domain-containing protein [Chitinophagales bacterium]
MKNFLISLCLITLALTTRANVQAGFTPDKTSGCPPLLVNFTNTSSSGNLNYRWDFGNGNSSTLANPSAMFLTSGTYTVVLVVTNGLQSDSAIQTITVFELPQVDFTALNINACEKDTVKFLSNVTPGDAPVTDYAWGFGDGIASSAVNAKHVYAQPGLFDITLVVQDANNCTANKTKHNYIQVFAKPTAAFVASPAISCNASELISFTSSSTGNGLSYYWDLDSNATSTQQNPTYTYNQEKRNVKLIVTDVNGCTDTVKHSISVIDLHANFTANKLHACAGETIKFTNLSNFPGTSWNWFFGDGTAANSPNPQKVYSNPGVYTVTFIVKDGPCSDTLVKPNYITITTGFAVSFNADVTSSCQTPMTVNFTNNTPNGMQFTWTFGDGTTSTQEDPTKLYTTNGTFAVTLTVTDSSGCSVTGIVPGMISTSLPIPRFNSDSVGCPGNNISFINHSSDAVYYSWNFGDGDTSNVSNPLHAYSAPGTYTVSLTATNAKGCDSTIVKHITIDDVHVDFAVNQTFSPCPPFVAIFHSTANKPHLKYKWSFGDGATDTAANPTHIYFYPGLYTVSVIATTTYGCSDTMTYVNLIEVQGPSGQFNVTPVEGCVPLTITVNATVSANTYSMWADLGDGGLVSDSLTFSYVYNQVDSFHPKFILIDHIGCKVSYNLPVIVTHTAPQLQLQDTAVCPGNLLLITAGADSYKWQPATGLNCDTCSTVVVNPTHTVVYTVTAQNQYGCRVSDNMTITVEPLPVISPSADAKVCKGQDVLLTAGNVARVAWSPSLYLNDSTSARPVCTPQQSITYTITAYNSLGCSNTDDVHIEVIEKVDVNAIGDTTLCVGGTVQLNSSLVDSSINDVKLNWYPANYLNNAAIANPIATVAGQAVNFMLVASAPGCAPDSETVLVNVSANPDIEASQDVTTTPGAEVQVYASSHSNLTYNWQAKDAVNCADCRHTYLNPTTSQVVYVTGTNAYGCSATDSLNINIIKCDPNSVYVPNTFTPNGDGNNDKLFIRSKTLANLEYFRVFDEWGRLVFETRNMQEGWDGTIGNYTAPLAVYVYTIKGQCENGADLMKSDNVAVIK